MSRRPTRAAAPGFSLASGTIFSTRESPSIYLTFQQVERLDFRVYKVRDPMAFVAGLKDPHQLGSQTPLVDQEPTTLERIASWKATVAAGGCATSRGVSSATTIARRGDVSKTSSAW